MLYILCGHHKNPYDSSLISGSCLLMYFSLVLVSFIFRMLVSLLCLHYTRFFSVVLISSLTASIKLHVCVLSHFSRDWLFCDPMDCSPPGSSVHEISQQEYWSGLPFPSLGIFLTQGSNPHLLHWQADYLPLSHQGLSSNGTHIPFCLCSWEGCWEMVTKHFKVIIYFWKSMVYMWF